MKKCLFLIYGKLLQVKYLLDKKLKKHHTQEVFGQTEVCWIPQIPTVPSTAAMLMYPLSPHEAPHEFLTM